MEVSQNVGYAVTVYDDGGGNKYYIDGVKQDTVTGLIRGATYTFDTSDSTVSSHPFRFSATSNGSHGGGSEYTNGVAAITGTATTITVPHDAPNTLYYYCTSHSGMGADITGITTNEKLADQYASHCVLALPLVGNNGDVSTSIACTSSTKAITSNGTVAASNVESNIYSGSFLFDGDSDYFTFAPGGDFAFGTADFTIECWCYSKNRGTYDYIIEGRNSGQTTGTWTLVYGYSGANPSTLEFATGSTTLLTCPTASNPEANRWFHVAVARSGTSLKMFIDGVEVTSATNSTDFSTSPSTSYIGTRYSQQHYWDGYMQDIRVYKGVAKYTSDFVVPSRSPNVLPDTPSGVSGGSKLTKITEGSVSFDGTAYLTVADGSNDFSFGTGAYTVEGYLYPTTLTGNGDANPRFFCCGTPTTSTNRNQLQIVMTATGQIRLDTNGTTYTSTAGDVAVNRWQHIAVARDGSGNLKAFVDGRQVISQTSVNNDITNNDGISLGIEAGHSSRFTGFMSNVRIIKGTALYTSRFTPPSAPLTNVTNTKLLCCESNASAGAAAVSPSISGLNNGTVWSDYLTTTTGANSRDFYTAASYPAPNLFDGDTSAIVYGGYGGAGNDSNLIFKPPSGISVSSKLEVYVGYYSKIKVNGADYNTGGESTAQGWVTVSDGSNFTGTLTNLHLENRSNANVVRASAIRIDDSTILLNPVSAKGDPSAFGATTFNSFNTDINTVRGQETGYATLNPLKVSDTSSIVLSDGNLRVDITGNYYNAVSTLGMSSGKFYCETSPVRGYSYFGIATGDVATNTWGGDQTNNTAWVLHGNGSIYHNNATTNGTGFPSTSGVAGGYTLGLLFDADNKTMRYVYKGAISKIYNMANTVDGDLFYFFVGGDAGSYEIDVNFGQKPFKFPPPDGFQPLNAANTRPTTVIARPDQYVGVTTYKGNNTVGRIIDIGRNADLVWVKKRTAENHILVDTVRGANNFLMSDATNTANTSGGPITGIGATVYNGFIVDNNGYVNANNADYVCWNWKAGGDKNTFNVDDVGYASAAAAGLTAGTLTISGASVGTKQGFSIIKYAGSGSNSTFPHGLTQAPDFYIIKCLDVGSEQWRVYHSSVGADYALTLNTSAEKSDSNIYFNDTEPTSTVASVYAGYDGVNNTGRNYISYLWHNVPGLQKFGTYEGLGGTANGSFVELGFRPAIVWVKNIDTASQSNTHWCVFDRLRPGFNKSPAQNRLHLDTNDQEDPDRVDDGQGIDILSNGFRVRSNNWYETNLSGATYIYCAWAEAPSIDLFGGGANAR